MSLPQSPGGIGRPTIFVECTHTVHSDMNTGIQRVVRNILRHAAQAAARHGYEVVPVILENGRLVPVSLDRVLANKNTPIAPAANPTAQTRGPWQRRVLAVVRPAYRVVLRGLARAFPFEPARRFIYAPPWRFGLAWCVLAPWRAARGLVRLAVGVAKGSPVFPGSTEASAGQPGGGGLDDYASHRNNILILLDSSWPFDVWPPVRRFRRKGGFVAAVIYDLIPLTHSHTCVEPVIQAFRAWLAELPKATDALITISRSVMEQVQAYLAAQAPMAPAERRPQLSYFYLGSELDLTTAHGQPPEMLCRAAAGPEHVFLVVGSIEPRKNHGFILDAFDSVWAAGVPATLLIVGHHSWKAESTLERIARHPQYGKRLFLMRGVSDDELAFAYDNASALIMASEVEGFGLPVVEALQRGLPVLCSDIPVFREIAGGRATFFGLDSPANLAGEIARFVRARDPSDRRRRDPQPWLTWSQSAEQLIDATVREAHRIQHGAVRIRAQA